MEEGGREERGEEEKGREEGVEVWRVPCLCTGNCCVLCHLLGNGLYISS